GIAGQIDPSKISNNTLGQIRDQLNNLVQDNGKASLGAQAATADIFKRYQDKPWVRNFIQHLVPQEITTRNVNQFNDLKDIVVLSDKDEDCGNASLRAKRSNLLNDYFANSSKTHHMSLRNVFYEDIDDKQQPKGAIDCLIALLPRDTKYYELDK
ncbi:MAG: hypothetical protein HQL13_08410, partial [Candidatus Omnitrophica bacterium]|nr:hypothetical protein [Candidatus Omnitrophota bacterium]